MFAVKSDHRGDWHEDHLTFVTFVGSLCQLGHHAKQAA